MTFCSVLHYVARNDYIPRIYCMHTIVYIFVVDYLPMIDNIPTVDYLPTIDNIPNAFCMPTVNLSVLLTDCCTSLSNVANLSKTSVSRNLSDSDRGRVDMS